MYQDPLMGGPKEAQAGHYVQQIQNQKTGDETFYINNIIFKIGSNEERSNSQIKRRSNSTDAATMKGTEEKILLKSINKLSEAKCNCPLKHGKFGGCQQFGIPAMQQFGYGMPQQMVPPPPMLNSCQFPMPQQNESGYKITPCTSNTKTGCGNKDSSSKCNCASCQQSQASTKQSSEMNHAQEMYHYHYHQMMSHFMAYQAHNQFQHCRVNNHHVHQNSHRSSKPMPHFKTPSGKNRFEQNQSQNQGLMDSRKAQRFENSNHRLQSIIEGKCSKGIPPSSLGASRCTESFEIYASRTNN